MTGQLVSFSSTGASDPEGSALSYSWNFGDGQSGSGQSTSHAYNSAGPFTATVTVSDGTATATATTSVLVKANSAPFAGSVSAPTTPGIVGTNMTFSSQNASDPDGNALSYSWNFGDGTGGTGQGINHAFASPGTFTVTLTVSDGLLTATASASVTVKSLSGSWRGSLVIDAIIVITQSGAGLSGTYNSLGLVGTISGSINSSTRRVTFTVTIPGFASFTFTGDPDSDVNNMNGVVNGSGFVNEAWSLKRI